MEKKTKYNDSLSRIDLSSYQLGEKYIKFLSDYKNYLIANADTDAANPKMLESINNALDLFGKDPNKAADYWMRDTNNKGKLQEANVHIYVQENPTFADKVVSLSEKVAPEIVRDLSLEHPGEMAFNKWQELGGAISHPIDTAKKVYEGLADLPDIYPDKPDKQESIEYAKFILSGFDPVKMPVSRLVDWFKDYFNKLEETVQIEIIQSIPTTIAMVVLSNPTILGSLAPGAATTLAAKFGTLAARSAITGAGLTAIEGVSEIEKRELNPKQLGTAFLTGVTAEVLNTLLSKIVASIGNKQDPDGTVRAGLIQKIRELFFKNRTPTPTEVYDAVAQFPLDIKSRQSIVEQINDAVERGTQFPEMNSATMSADIKKFRDRLMDPSTSIEAIQLFKKFYDKVALMAEEGRYMFSPEALQTKAHLEAMRAIIERALTTAPDAFATNLRSIMGRILGLGLAGAIIGGIASSAEELKKVGSSILNLKGKEALGNIKKIPSKFIEGAKYGGPIGAGVGTASIAFPMIQSSPLAQRLLASTVAKVADKGVKNIGLTTALSKAIAEQPGAVDVITANTIPLVTNRNQESTGKFEIPIYELLKEKLKRQTKKKYTIEKVEK